VQRWSVVVPVKRLHRAKTRLRASLPDVDHDALVLAMALDTVAAALASPPVGAVIVVTDDPVAAPALAALGAVCIPDEPDAGLNPALEHGAAEAVRRAPDWGVAVLGSDLPALRPAELASALEAVPSGSGRGGPGGLDLAGGSGRAVEPGGLDLAGGSGRAGGPGATTGRAVGPGRAFVADAAGTGTTLLAAGPRVALRPAYGPASAAAHAASGAVALSGDWPSLRRDVDTAADLRVAAALTLGPRSASVIGLALRIP
jgi:2-phospho-L-lactate guanylyltransferase